MKILENEIKKEDLKNSENIVFDEFVKAVVDIEKEEIAIDAELHADLEKYLLENGSNQYDLWGINLYFDEDEENFVEFDSMINIRPAQGNRGRGVENKETQEKIKEVVSKWIK
jgi:hypothetical protein